MILRLRSLLYRLMLILLRRVPPLGRRSYRLVVLKLDRLGDGVLSLGAVRLLLGEYGARDTLLIVSTVAEPLFRREFPEAELLVMPPFCERFWPDFLQTMVRHAARLRAIKAEHLVCLRHQTSDYLYAIAALMQVSQVHSSRWLRAWERACLSYPTTGEVPYPEQSEHGCLELEAHRRVVESVLGRPVAFPDILPVLQAAPVQNPAGLLVCPLTGSALRQYPPPQLARVVELFLRGTSGVAVTFCLPPWAERRPWEDALQEAGITDAVEWLQPQSLEELIHAISAARLVLAPDSAPAHLATAMNKPGVFLLGGGHYGMFAPWRSSACQIWLNHDMSCYQCRWNCVHPEPLCITQIGPAAVAAAMQEAYAAGTV